MALVQGLNSILAGHKTKYQLMRAGEERLRDALQIGQT